MGHGKKLRRHRNALKVYTPDIATIVLAMPDEEASDGLSLGPLAEETSPTNLTADIKGTSYLNKQQYSELVTNFSDIFTDNPGVASLACLSFGHRTSTTYLQETIQASTPLEAKD